MIAEARLPRVLKLPLPLTQSERFLAVRAERATLRDPATPPASVNVVVGFEPAPWLPLKLVPQASALSSAPLASRTTVTLTTPWVASITVPLLTTIGSPRKVLAPPGCLKLTL